MNAPFSRLFVALTLVLIAGITPSESLRAADTSIWLAKDAKTSGGGMLLPDTEGAADFEIADVEGITIGEKPPGGGDTKSLEFAGTQVLAFRTVSPFPAGTAGFKVQLKVRVTEETLSQDTTILRHATQWEIRYLHKRKAYLFVVWHEPTVVTELVVSAEPGEWQNLTAEFRPDKMTFATETEKTDGVPKDTMVEEPKPQVLLLGASGPRPVDGELPRPFVGALADIRITVE